MVALYKHRLGCMIIITSFFAVYLSSNSLDSTWIQAYSWEQMLGAIGMMEYTVELDKSLVYGSCIDSMCVTYDKDGRSFPAVKHGGMGGTKSAQIKLEFPEEILIGVSGHFYHVVHGGFPVVRSLTLKSYRRTFGPFGVEQGSPFNFFTNGGHIVGFYGRSGWFLDSVGFHLSSHKPNLFRRTPVMFKESNHRAVEDEDNEH